MEEDRLVPEEIEDTTCMNVRILLDVLADQGVRHIVASPGSRNAPLLLGAANRPEFKKTILDDERTAAFYALGISMITHKPTVLICTSGTALYNYAPAIAEAYYQKVPLIVISADRPSQWIDQDDSQTLRQPGAFRNIVKRSFDISFDGGMKVKCQNTSFASEHEWYVNRVANDAYITSTCGQPGPVHINIQLAAPLGKTECTPRHRSRIVEVITADDTLSHEAVKRLAEELKNKRIMVVAGFMPPDIKLNRTLSIFARQPNVTLLCETISNLHIDGNPQMIDSLLCRMDQNLRDELAPDVVISIGGALVSRMLKEYLRNSSRTQHWTLQDTDVSIDCFQRLTKHIEVSPQKFFASVGGALNKLRRKSGTGLHDDYNEKWEQLRLEAETQNAEFIRKAPWSELTALQTLFQKIPANCNLILSNGTPIRYAQLLLDKMPHGCYCNRGVSGIEGGNATALGASSVYSGMTLLITGDMSFAYCPEVLNLIQKGGDLRIVVINNSGGGIFRFIETTRRLDIREEYFCSNPDLPLAKVTESYGWNYLKASTPEEMKEAVRKLLRTPRTLLEIEVEPEQSSKVLIDFLKTK